MEGARPVARMHTRPDRGVRVHPLAGRRARQQLQHHLEIAERRHDLLDPHHRHEHLGQRRAHPAVALGLDDDDAPGVGAGEVRSRDGDRAREELLAQKRPRRRGQLLWVVGQVREAEPRMKRSRISVRFLWIAGTRRCEGRRRQLARSARRGRSREARIPAASSASLSRISSVASDFTFTTSSTLRLARSRHDRVRLCRVPCPVDDAAGLRHRRLELERGGCRAAGARDP